MAVLDINQIRACFPSLKSGHIYADNAGGSRTAQAVIDRIVEYLTNTNAQLEAGYSAVNSQLVVEGTNVAAELFNAASLDEVGFGSSSTMLFENLSRALENDIQPGDEFIITYEHEGACHCLPVSFVEDTHCSF